MTTMTFVAIEKLSRRDNCKILKEGVGFPFPKMSVAKDGHSQAHMDVLVAVFGKGNPTAARHKTLRLQGRAPTTAG